MAKNLHRSSEAAWTQAGVVQRGTAVLGLSPSFSFLPRPKTATQEIQCYFKRVMAQRSCWCRLTSSKGQDDDKGDDDEQAHNERDPAPAFRLTDLVIWRVCRIVLDTRLCCLVAEERRLLVVAGHGVNAKRGRCLWYNRSCAAVGALTANRKLDSARVEDARSYDRPARFGVTATVSCAPALSGEQ